MALGVSILGKAVNIFDKDRGAAGRRLWFASRDLVAVTAATDHDFLGHTSQSLISLDSLVDPPAKLNCPNALMYVQ